ncbi:MAG: repeat-containing protein [Acidobacteriales bacterium]|nr:repeat-containing protein [Terriglobales bacterium]
MKKHVLPILVLSLSLNYIAAAQTPATHSHSANPAKAPATKPVQPSGMSAFNRGLGNLHHPVTTQNVRAQQLFDQGLRLIFGFNHDEAVRSFEEAAKLDPKLAMAYWGIAYAKGPNYNVPVDLPHEMAAYEAVQKAKALSANASESDKAYINAIAARYSNDPVPDFPKLAVAYKDAMRDLSHKYPDDLDAATIYAESMMNLNPWGLWTLDGKPWEFTPEITRVLESVLRRDPNHMGAIHLYIHAVEASPDPERALAAANRLAALAPTAGHLVHMPAHIYSRIGDYDSATRTNVDAAKADENYVQSGGLPGIYPMMYYSHNLHFIAYASSMGGGYAQAKQAADRLAAHVGPHVKEMPPLEGFMGVPGAVLVRFGRWDDILALPAPDPQMKNVTALWHFARGMAFVGKGNLAEAAKEHQQVVTAENNTAADAVFSMPFNNKTRDVLKIADDVLAAKIAIAQKDNAKAIPLLQDAVAIQDSLKYGEPPDWFSPVRETLGAALLMNGNAVEAEKVFRADLDRNPRNARSLFGLREALKAQGKAYDAQFVNREFADAWKNADVKLTVKDL